MKAITYSRFGAAAEVLTVADLSIPTPGHGEVVVDLAYSGVNPSDIKARAGARPGITKPPFPVIVPHSDGAGVISSVGEGVPSSRIGERVWVWNGQWRRAFGTAAEQIALPAEQAVRLPDTVSLETGAVLGIPGLTACHTVFSGGSVADRTVLVQGGGGTVGHLAVQLAKWGGAKVIATSAPDSFSKVRKAGADAVLDYAAPDVAQQILAANDGQPVNRIIEVEFGLNVQTDIEVIAENGRINAYGSAGEMTPALPFYPLMFKAITLEISLVYLLKPEQRTIAIERLTRALEARALDAPIQSIHDLSDCARAHDLVESEKRNGAVLLKTAV